MTANEFSSAEAYQRLGAIISQVQSRFIRAAPTREVFDPLLTDLLGFTGSGYGFIADLMQDPVDDTASCASACSPTSAGTARPASCSKTIAPAAGTSSSTT